MKRFFTVVLILLDIFVVIGQPMKAVKDAQTLVSVSIPEVQAADEVPTACIGQELLKYLAAVEEGTRGLKNIRLLSPAFNMTNPAEYEIYQVMKTSPAPGGGAGIEVFKRIWGFAGNTYSLSGVSAYDWVTKKTNWLGETAGATGKQVIFTEFGDFDTFGDGKGMGSTNRGEIIDNMRREFKITSADGKVAGINYFNALGGNPQFIGHKLDNGELSSIVSSNSKKGGVNSGLFIQGGNFQDQANQTGANLGWTVEIITNPGDLQSAFGSVTKGYANGMQTVLRACVGDSCGFSNPADYVKFLKDLNALVPGPVYVIAGPNEPATEHWAAPRCKVEKPFDLNEIPCNQTSGGNNEYHSLRPYPTNPCRKDPPVVRLCGQDLVVSQTISLVPSDGVCDPLVKNADGTTSQHCVFNISSNNTLSFGLNKADFPIMGNTELVKNSVSSTQTLDFKQRINEYVSWYLNGIPQRAEEPFAIAPNNINDIINLSGPLKKLLPKSIQIDQRNKEKNQIGNDRHDQIVSCGDKANPQACYSETSDPKNRLSQIDTRSNSHEYIPFTSTEDLPGTFYAGVKTTSDGVSDIAVNLTKEDQTLFFAHMEEDPQLADLLQRTFVSGTFVTNGQTRYKVNDGNAPDGKLAELNNTPYCELLESRANPGDKLYGELERPNKPATTPIAGTLSFKAKLECDFATGAPDNDKYLACMARTKGADPAACKAEATPNPSECIKDVNVGLGVQVDTPNIYSAWDKLVAGSYSVVKRIFPKVGANTPITEIKNIPGDSYANYSSNGTVQGGSLVGGKTLAGNPNANRAGSTAKIYFPYLGSIYDYFLKGIQIALRPKANDIANNPQEDGAVCEINCNINAPEDPKYSKYKPVFVDLATRLVAGKGKHYAAECFNDVVDRSKKAGVNPMFALVIWLHESGASNYGLRFGCQIADFGIVSGGAPKSDFNFQLDGFLTRPAAYKFNYPLCYSQPVPSPEYNGQTDMLAFNYIFLNGPGAGQSCTNPLQSVYYDAVVTMWDWIVPGCTNTSASGVKTFTISSPTDMSCP